MAISDKQYDVLAARRVAKDSLLWQTPALSLTAQAFLFTIALGQGTTVGARLIAAILALVASLASIQLMAKSRYFEEGDSKMLEEYERAMGFQTIHARPDYSKKAWYVKRSSYRLWIFMLAIFGAAAVVVIVGLAASCAWIVGTAS